MKLSQDAKGAGRYARSFCLYLQQGFPKSSARRPPIKYSPPPEIDGDQPHGDKKMPTGTVDAA